MQHASASHGVGGVLNRGCRPLVPSVGGASAAVTKEEWILLGASV
jgi:hypothetical protein